MADTWMCPRCVGVGVIPVKTETEYTHAYCPLCHGAGAIDPSTLRSDHDRQPPKAGSRMDR
jgi:DnaJ-class molecular chaperone